jgi:hypothetical protein
MPDVSDFHNRLEAIRKAVLENLPRIAETLCITAKALAERRMKDQGFGVVYSKNPVPAWFFKGKELNQRGVVFLNTGKVKGKKTGKPKPLEETTWGEFRQAQGLQAAFVDLSYSNKMWANMGATTTEESDGVVSSLLGGTNREAQNKMNWNRERYGDFIRKSLTDEDGVILGDVVISELTSALEQFKL